MHIDKKNFSDIDSYNLPEYFVSHITNKTELVVITYKHGEKIADNEGFTFRNQIEINKPLGVIVEGKAEIYETYVADKYFVYRPIRLMKTGDLLGEFSILDYICCGNNISKRGEKWEICSGFISILIKQCTDPANFKPDSKFYASKQQHIITHNSIKEETKIVFFDASFINKDSDSLVNLFIYSWPYSKIYRDSLNSFNFSQLLEFRQKANLIADELLKLKDTTANKLIYDKEIGRTTFTQYFIDAVWDTYNRPIRGEPMFAQATENVLGNSVAEFNKRGIDINNVLIATDDFSFNDLWFPIDTNNYLIAANFDFSDKPYFSKEEKKAIEEKQEKALKAIKKVRKNSNINKSPREFYIHFCEKLLEVLDDNHNQYPFDVSCEDIEFIENNILMLHFKRKQVTND